MSMSATRRLAMMPLQRMCSPCSRRQATTRAANVTASLAIRRVTSVPDEHARRTAHRRCCRWPRRSTCPPWSSRSATAPSPRSSRSPRSTSAPPRARRACSSRCSASGQLVGRRPRGGAGGPAGRPAGDGRRGRRGDGGDAGLPAHPVAAGVRPVPVRHGRLHRDVLPGPPVLPHRGGAAAPAGAGAVDARRRAPDRAVHRAVRGRRRDQPDVVARRVRRRRRSRPGWPPRCCS